MPGVSRRDTAASARWLLCHGDVRMCRSRIKSLDTRDELQTWVAVYNDVRDDLEPAKQDVGEALARRADELSDGE